MPEFTLSPADLATIAQLEESRTPREPELVDTPSMPMMDWIRAGREVHPYDRHYSRKPYALPPGILQTQSAWRKPEESLLRYEALLKELAPFVEETRRNERALEAIPFVSAR
jgi:hypothetical protein